MDVSGALVVLAMLGIRFLFTATRRRHEYPTDPQSDAKNPPPDDPRWLPSTDEPQVVGKACAHCHAAFVTAREGRPCKTCGALVHRKGCLAEHRRANHVGSQTPYR